MIFNYLLALGLSLSPVAFAQAPASDVVDMETAQKEQEKKDKKEKEAAANSVATEVPAPSKNYKNVEKLEVTGSYIKRIDLEGPSPVVTFGKEDFDNAGVNTVNDYMRENPLFESTTTGGPQEGYFRFHGQHAGNTLVLLNGMRLPKIGAAGRDFYNGVRGIPTNAIDRVEVLKDGSSALYGSDAMAGVVNFITNKDYDGAEFSTKIDIPEIGVGIEQNHSMTFGKNYARGNWLASVQYVKQDAVTDADVGNYYRENRYFQPTTTSTLTVPGQKPQDIGPTCDGQECSPDVRDINYYRNNKENIGALLTGHREINSNLNVNFLGMYNRRSNVRNGRPDYINFNPGQGGSLDVSKIPSNGLKASAVGSDKIDAAILPIDEVGLGEMYTVEDSFNAQAKVEGFVGDTWSWNLSGSHGASVESTDHINGLIDKSVVREMIYSGAYDVTARNQNAGALSAANVQAREAYESSMSTARFLATGEVFDFNNVWGTGGPFAMAIGMESQWESSADASDAVFYNSELTTNIGQNPQKGSRQVSSTFLELSSYPLSQVELQMAARYDNYSDFGDTFNPKFSVGYRPSNKILLRSSWGTNFHAPSVRNMIFQGSQGFESFRDEYLCQQQGECNSDYYRVVRYKDPNIGPETGVNYNFGTVIQPDRHWTFTIDQWNFEGKNTIAKIFGNQYSQWANIIGEETLAKSGVIFERDPSTNKILSVTAPEVINLGERTIRGLDFKMDYDTKVKLLGRVMSLSASSNHSHFLVYKTKRVDFFPMEYRADLNWRNTSSLSLRNQNHTYRVAARTVAAETGRRTITPTHTEYDFSYRYATSWGGRISVGVKNMMNAKPPINISPSVTYVDYTGADSAFQALGRRYYMGYSQTF
ncbi:MAG: TonB-dependent receptor [Bdellovibrionales bacterium]|nr:TonB-dependent receptor [Bdellovibrionales bacterium]